MRVGVPKEIKVGAAVAVVGTHAARTYDTLPLSLRLGNIDDVRRCGRGMPRLRLTA